MGPPSRKYNKVARDDKLPSDDSCGTCAKRVYAAEMLKCDGQAYHKACFKCCCCQKPITFKSYAALNGKLYCKPHFQQLFKRAGSYDGGGFGTVSPARQSPVNSPAAKRKFSTACSPMRSPMRKLAMPEASEACNSPLRC